MPVRGAKYSDYQNDPKFLDFCCKLPLRQRFLGAFQRNLCADLWVARACYHEALGALDTEFDRSVPQRNIVLALGGAFGPEPHMAQGPCRWAKAHEDILSRPHHQYRYHQQTHA